jgi:hypothetical protein
MWAAIIIKTKFQEAEMALAYAASGAMPRALPVEGRSGAMRDRATTAFHVISVVTVFAFVLSLTAGVYR